MSSNNKIIEVLSECISGEYVIPIFQRRYDWKEDQVASLVASTFFEIIPGSFLIFNAPASQFKFTKIGVKSFSSEGETKKKFVIDGQQRLTSYLLAFTDYFHKLSNSIFSTTAKKFYLELDPEDNIFGFKHLVFREPSLDNYDYDSFCNRIKSCPINRKMQNDNPNVHYLDLSLFINTFGNKLKRDNLPFYSSIDLIAKNRAHDILLYIENNKEDIIKLQNHIDLGLLDFDSETIMKKLQDKANVWATSVFNYITSKMMQRELNIVEIPDKNLEFVLKSYQIMNTSGKSLDTLDILASKFASINDEQKLYDKINNNMSTLIDIYDYDLFYVAKNSQTNDKKIEWDFMKYLVVGAKDNKKTDTPTKVTDQIIKMVKYISIKNNNDIMISVMKDSLYKTNMYSNSELLALTPEDITKYIDKACKSVSIAGAFLQLNCGLRSISDLVHFWKLFVLSAIFYEIEKPNQNQLRIIYDWYWISRFTGRYRIDQNNTALQDLRKLLLCLEEENKYKLIDKNSTDEMIRQSRGLLDTKILLNIHEINDPIQLQKQFIAEFGIRKGYPLKKPVDGVSFISVLTASLTGESKFALEMDHFFPVKGKKSIFDCTSERSNKRHIINAPLNFTYISSLENKTISNVSPSEYQKILTPSYLVNAFLSNEMFNADLELEDALRIRYDNFIKSIGSEFNLT